MLFGNQANIPVLSKNVPVLPKILPSKTLDAVALCGFSHLTRNRNAKATAIVIIFDEINNKVLIPIPLPVI